MCSAYDWLEDNYAMRYLQLTKGQLRYVLLMAGQRTTMTMVCPAYG